MTFDPLSAVMRQQTYTTMGCSLLVLNTTTWMCTPLKPLQRCKNDTQCAAGDYCITSGFCVNCAVNGTGFTAPPEKFEVIANVTQAIIARKFWTLDEYYDHTDVDYIQTYQKWSWAPNGRALQHDFVRYWRGLGSHLANHDDSFSTFSRVYELWNSTHVRYRSMETRRSAHDVTGVIDMTVTSSEEFYAIVNKT